MRTTKAALSRQTSPDLFGQVERRYPHCPGFKRTDASREAAVKIVRHAETVRNLVLAEFIAVGPRGLTADECGKLLGESVLTVRPRVSELRAAGRIEPTEERRVNDSRMSATVWRATAEAHHG